MKIGLTIISGPHKGREFDFDGRDTFLVGRTSNAHLQLSYSDPYFSRRHFLIEVNPPDPDGIETLNLPAKPASIQTIDYVDSSTLIPGFQIKAELGRGGMGIVYRAVRESDGQLVALKTIRPADRATPKQIDRFIRECSILKQLDHPNIVAFKDIGEVNGIVYLVMDLVEGSDLSAILKERGPMQYRPAVGIIFQVLDGLALAHEKGFVHRDVKPQNILVDDRMKVAKLADFGLARIYESSKISGLTMQGEVGGTPAFMAPEQVTHYRQVKPAADLYSVRRLSTGC